MPVAVATLLFYIILLWSVHWASFGMHWLLKDSLIYTWIITPCLLVLLVACGLRAANAMMTLLLDLDALPQQVKQFSISESQCFCCSNAHKDPDSDVIIPCDREL